MDGNNRSGMPSPPSLRTLMPGLFVQPGDNGIWEAGYFTRKHSIAACRLSDLRPFPGIRQVCNDTKAVGELSMATWASGSRNIKIHHTPFLMNDPCMLLQSLMRAESRFATCSATQKPSAAAGHSP